jgi:hypothetical protein
MKLLWSKHPIHPKDINKVMTVLAVNNDIYIASSVKGTEYTYTLEDSEVVAALGRCQEQINKDTGL